MLLEIGIMLYILLGLCIYAIYIKDVHQHAKENLHSRYLRRIAYIVTFIITVLMWPLLVGI